MSLYCLKTVVCIYMLLAKKNSQDFSFHYMNVLRQVFLTKLSLKHSMALPLPKKIMLSFSLKDLMNQENSQTRSFLYFFKFFFGYKASITNRQSVFSLGITYYSFDVQLILLKRDFFKVLSFFSNDILPFLEGSSINVDSLYKLVNVEIKDMSIFTEKKTNAALFELTNPLYLFLNFNVSSEIYKELFLSGVKVFLNKNVF